MSGRFLAELPFCLAAALTLAACMVESKSSFTETPSRDLAVVQAILVENGHDENVMENGCSFCVIDYKTGRIRRIDFGVYRIKSLPSGLETLTGLEELILDEAVVGGFPESLCGAASLRKLSWKKGELGSLPGCIGNLSRLEYLDLSGNRISELPESFGNLDSLVTLDLGGNQSGVLAPVLSGCASLSVLRIENLFLNGTLPALVAGLPRLRVLDVGRNGFTTVPEAIWSCPMLREVSLDGNRITRIPQALMSMATLKVLSISDNPLCSVTQAEADWLDTMDRDWRSQADCFPGWQDSQ